MEFVFVLRFVTFIHSLSMASPTASVLYKFHITFTLLWTYSAYSSERKAAWFHCLLLKFSLGLKESLPVFCCTSPLHFRIKASIHGYIILFPFSCVWRGALKPNFWRSATKCETPTNSLFSNHIDSNHRRVCDKQLTILSQGSEGDEIKVNMKNMSFSIQ